MNPQDPAHYSPIDNPHQKVGNELTVMRPGERVVCIMKRHPIGIVGIYLATFLMLSTLAVLIFAVAPSLTTDSDTKDKINTFGVLFLFFFIILSSAFAYISNKVYWGNRWILTTDSLTQISQTSLFNRQSSQLSLHNIEDVTAEQNGILAHAFGYGVLRAETAGETAKFYLTYCPNPNYFATKILHERENQEMEAHGQQPNQNYQASQPQQQSISDQPPILPTPPTNPAPAPQPQDQNNQFRSNY